MQLTRAGRRQGRRATAALLLLALAAAAAPGCQRQPARIPPRRDPGWLALLVQGEGAAAAVAGVGGRVAAGLPLVGGLLAGVRADRVAGLARRPGVRLVVDADRPLRLEGEPADQDAPAAPGGGVGGADATGAPRVWPLTRGEGVTVGLLDTGVAASADLAGRVAGRLDLGGDGTAPAGLDAYGHGTFMAGLIAGDGHGGGPAGVAPGADLLDLRVAGGDGRTTLGRVLYALQLADASRRRFNLKVLNLSLGAPADDPATAPLTEAVERLWADGVTVVAAAGNDGGAVDAPGLDPYVLTAGALDAGGAGRGDDLVPAWSSRGPDYAGRAKPDLVAPGVRLVSLRSPGSTIDREHPGARVGDGYFRGSGTSMSTALLAGAAALVAAAHPGWGPDEIKGALRASAGLLPHARQAAGAGALDLAGAVRTAVARAANGDLVRLRPAGEVAAPADPPGRDAPAGWRVTGDGLRWDTGGWGGQAWERLDADAGPWLAAAWTPGETAGGGWSGQQWLARSWAARSWQRAGLQVQPWAALQWAWAAGQWAWADAPEDRTAGGRPDLGWPDGGWPDGGWAARSWAARSWAARSWAARSWAARSWAARSWDASG